MFRLLTLFAVIGYCSGRAVVLNLDPNKAYYRLEPVNNEKTVWNLQSPEGSKIIITCLADRCGMNTARVIHSEGDWDLCSEWKTDPMILSSTTARLEMDPSNNANVICNVTATKGYLNVEDISTESDEEGLPTDEKPTCPCGWTNKDGGRIVGGKRALKNEYPFMATVGRVGEPRPDCGGSIITPYHVLTAAHCIFPYIDYYKFQVGVGVDSFNETGENDHTQIIKVKTAYNHQKYEDDLGEFNYDISLLYLERKIIFDKWIGPVCMPRDTGVELGQYLKVIGWGKLHTSHSIGSNYLMKANVRVIDLDVCSKIHGASRILGHSQYCTFHSKKDSCQGDSGGPLVMVNPRTNMLTQYALVSFGKSCNSSSPAVNTKVASYMTWIKAKITESQNAELCY